RRLKPLPRLQRAVCRKAQGSHNRQHAVHTQAMQHRTVANQRAHTLHQLTSRLAKTTSVVVIEDLHVSGMLKHHHLAQAISAVGCAELRRPLQYTARWYGCRLIVADCWFASPRTCSGCECGWRDETLTLADRTFVCRHPDRPDCGLVRDHD